MKTINVAQFQAIQRHLMSGVNLVQIAGKLLPTDAEAGLKFLERAEAELMRALQMYCALPEEGDHIVDDNNMILANEDPLHTCGDCGAELTQVRPGKWQCDVCEAGSVGCVFGSRIESGGQ